MPTTRRLHIQPPHDRRFEQAITRIKHELDLPLQFPAAVEAAAEQAVASGHLPDLDRTDIPLVTIDPPGAMDLDQALHVERHHGGYRVHYAIADVASFVQAGDAIDIEAHRRGETLYGADAKIPLHPKAVSEDAASLLPEQTRPALLWSIDLDESGEGVAVDVRRARVRSRARFDYAGMQARIDAGTADAMWDMVREVGELRIARQRLRGGISLSLPEQEIRAVNSHWALEFRARHPVEDWNEQLSLLTGMAAAHLMVRGRIGLLRTLPRPDPRTVERLRRSARAWDIDWPDAQPPADFINALDPTNPLHVAMMVASTRMLRGAGYTAFRGDLPAQHMHSALAAEYTHATAPLRRLVDRYTGEICVALCAGQPVPSWVLDALPGLPATMRDSGHRASRYEHAVLDLVEAVVLEGRVGEVFSGSIVEVDHEHPQRGDAMVREPAIEARVDGDVALPLGEHVKLRLTQADPDTRKVRFAWVGDANPS